MFTAKQLLTNTDYEALPERLEAEPERLRAEFLAIAADPNEHYLFRTRSLRILDFHANELGVFSSSDVADGLLAAFPRYFTPEKLNELANALRIGHRPWDSWLAYVFCVTLARVAPDRAQGAIDSVRQIFKGTARGSSLDSHLALLKRLREERGRK